LQVIRLSGIVYEFMKTVLVTGGAGFIGSHISDRLLKIGYEVVVFDNLSTGLVTYVPPGAHLEQGDIRNETDVTEVFAKYTIDVVLHIAGQASQITSYTKPTYDIEENYVGTVHVVNAAIAHGVERFLYASSMTVYGAVEEKPVEETHLCAPISYYGISKYAGERYVHATGMRNDLKHPFNPTSFRMFNVYGPRQSLTNPYQGVMGIFIGNIVNNNPVTIFGDGQQSRDFVYIDDVVRAWELAIDNKHSFQTAINISSGTRISLNALIPKLIAAAGKDPALYKVNYLPARPGEQRHMQANIQKAKTTLIWEPQVSMEDGIKKTLDWATKSS
jgi:UDP-glucose 4-epimerase